jgi:hypothetical protein
VTAATGPVRVLNSTFDRRTGERWITCQWADGHVQDMPPNLVPVNLIADYATRLRRNAGLAGLGDELSQLVDDVQAQGREWFLQQILALDHAERLHRTNAEGAREVNRADLVEEAEALAGRARQIRDNLYWLVDTYLGGVDALPNVVPVGGARRRTPAPARPQVRAVQVILGAIGILSGAALLAWIANCIRVATERKQLIDAAKETGNDSFLEPLKDGTNWGYWAGVATVVAALIWGPGLLKKARRQASAVRSREKEAQRASA